MPGKPGEELVAKLVAWIKGIEAAAKGFAKVASVKPGVDVRLLFVCLAMLRDLIREMRIPGVADSVKPPPDFSATDAEDSVAKGPDPELSATDAKDPLEQFLSASTRFIAKLGVVQEEFVKQEAQPRENWNATFADCQRVLKRIKEIRMFFCERTDLPVQQDVHHCEALQGRPDALEQEQLDAALRNSEVEDEQASDAASEKASEELPMVPERMLTQDTDDLCHPYAAMEEPTTWAVQAATAWETHGTPATEAQVPMVTPVPVNLYQVVCFPVFYGQGQPTPPTLFTQQIAPQIMFQQHFPLQQMQANSPTASNANPANTTLPLQPPGAPSSHIPQVAGDELQSVALAVASPKVRPKDTSTAAGAGVSWADLSADSEEAADGRQRHDPCQTQAQLWKQPGKRGELTKCKRCDRIYDSVLSCTTHRKETSLCLPACALLQRRAVGCVHFHQRRNCNRNDCKFCHCPRTMAVPEPYTAP
jgi:hypothetical protein